MPEEEVSGFLHERLAKKFEASGERAILVDSLKERLADSGFKHDLKALCKDLIKERAGKELTVESLLKEVRTDRRRSVRSRPPRCC